jgi:hypothetical protein
MQREVTISFLIYNLNVDGTITWTRRLRRMPSVLKKNKGSSMLINSMEINGLKSPSFFLEGIILLNVYSLIGLIIVSKTIITQLSENTYVESTKV